jgi:division protein CdvB (Snf7/Vps24/ESCRT-III family)
VRNVQDAEVVETTLTADGDTSLGAALTCCAKLTDQVHGAMPEVSVMLEEQVDEVSASIFNTPDGKGGVEGQ